MISIDLHNATIPLTHAEVELQYPARQAVRGVVFFYSGEYTVGAAIAHEIPRSKCMKCNEKEIAQKILDELGYQTTTEKKSFIKKLFGK